MELSNRIANTVKDEITELWDMVVSYFKQETLDPLKAVLRFVTYGILGSVLLVFAFGFLTLGVLRLVQSETGSTFSGHLSWLPYLVALVFVLVLGALSVMGIMRYMKSTKQVD